MNANTHPNVDAQSPPSSSPPLQRGKACLACRRRKMKCDGARPICTPCLRGERSEDCEYTDSQRRPRTLMLEEDVARLRARLRELENPEEAVPSVILHAPYATAGPGTMGSTPADHAHASSSSYYQAGSTRQVQPYAIPGDVATEVYIRDALSVIAPYAAELGFFLNLDRLCVQGTPILPALQSALKLWSVHIASTSEPDYGQALERNRALTSNLLSQAQTQLVCALSNVDAEPDLAVFLHMVQTGVLLAYYMQRIGQRVGARYHASGTWALGMMLKLHRIPSLSGGGGEQGSESLMRDEERDGPERGNGGMCAFVFADGHARLAQALDGIEAEERVRAFWAVFTLDRWFSAVGQWPPQSLAVDGKGITVPWPDVGPIMLEDGRNVAQHLLTDPDHDFTRDGPRAMPAKASVLLCEAAAVAWLYVADNAISQSTVFQARLGILDTLLQRCLNTAMSMATAPQGQGQGQALVTVHLVAFAQVTLHRPFTSTSSRSSRRRCVGAAFDVVRVLDHMGEVGVTVGSISPIYATIWTALCLTLRDEILRLRTRPDADPFRGHERDEMVGAIRKLVGMLSRLSQHCPSRFFAVKIETLLPILESITV